MSIGKLLYFMTSFFSHLSPSKAKALWEQKAFCAESQKLAFVPAEWGASETAVLRGLRPGAIRRPTRSIVFVFHVYTSESTVLNFLNI